MPLDSILRSVLMVLGIGLVIFVHEFGHFLAARLCKVRVDVFSLGFGPKLLGFRRGDTLYQIAVLPIGGYVRMAGEERESEGDAPRPDELRAKSVGARFFIYSGGVLMNMVFAVVVLPLVLFTGVPFNEPLIGGVTPGGAAWQAGLEPGTRVLEFNGSKITNFESIVQEAALASEGPMEMLVLRPGATQPTRVTVEPSYDEAMGLATLGIQPAYGFAAPILVKPEGAAAAAGLTENDRIVSCGGALPELPPDASALLALRRGESLALRVADAEGKERDVLLEPKWEEVPGRAVLGLAPAIDRVVALRPNADLAALGLAVGDRVLRANGKCISREHDLELALADSSAGIEIVLEREGAIKLLKGPKLERARALELARAVALRGSKQCRVQVSPRAAVDGQVESGDVLLSANGVPLAEWETDFLPIARSASADGLDIVLKLERRDAAGAVSVVDVTVKPGLPLQPDYGFGWKEAMYTYRADSFAEAVEVGTRAAWKFLVDSWQMIKHMVLGRVSSKHMGGIISIGLYAYSGAGMGLAKLIFFLCLLSVNLAFINVLPVPLLDGGHLMFLAIEKLKGSPVSERVFGYSQVVGLVLILSLLVYVTYNDVVRVMQL
ncbi:MAG: RIP metalloprotease RseP [Planctomycetota bacterium]|nr:RIP metalloprotease RseP [Planctomycetota bacterium]